MGNKKGDDMQGVSEEFIDRSAVLNPAQVRGYMEPKLRGEAVKTARTGHTEYNNGNILVRSKHPIDECLRRGIIEEHHADSGKRIMTIRDCAFSRTSGRIYNDMGEGDSGVDALTLFTETSRAMKKLGNPKFGGLWGIIKIVCFSEPDIDGNYFSAAEYAALYHLAPNIQSGFEELDKAVSEARKVIKDRIETAAKHC